jgi:hypothetical protein
MPGTHVRSIAKPKQAGLNSRRPNNAAAKRKRAPPPGEWDEKKPYIRELLLVEKRPLEAVMETLRKEHNFHAGYYFRIYLE